MQTTEITEEVRRRQAARLERKAAAGLAPRGRPSPWAHVKLPDLFRDGGNAVFGTESDAAESGHQPFHGSRSGRCVLISTKLGLWYCRSCQQGGDALTLWMAKSGLGRRQAAAELSARFGPPARRRRRGKVAVRWTEV